MSICSVPDCPEEATEQGRCKEHRKQVVGTGSRGSTRSSRRRRQSTLEKANYRCHYCGIDEATIEDHFVPLAAGGADDSSNTVAACQHCNSRKGSSMPGDFLRSDWLRERREAVARRRAAP
jgi:5-methylcytosine-specific restriction endonuclease McrA